MNEKKRSTFAVSAILVNYTNQMNVHALGQVLAESEEAAIAAYAAKLMQEEPDCDVKNIIAIEIRP